MRSSIRKTIALFSFVAFFSTNVWLAYPETARAQAGAASSCVVGYAAALTASASALVNDIIGVPSSEKDTGQDGLASGSANALSFNNCVLKPLGQTMVITLIRNIGASVVDWVNSGFEGKPLFVTDFEGTLLDAADQAIGSFIEGSELGWLCNDFSFQIRIALATKYSKPFREQVRCTLSDISDNMSGFTEENGGRGWDNWLRLTTRPNNNKYGAFLIADTEASRRALEAASVKEKKITISEGFLNFETCDEWETPSEAAQSAATASYNSGAFDTSTSFENFDTGIETIQFGDGPAISVSSSNQTPSAFNSTIEGASPKCKSSSIKTPGKIIGSKLSSVLGQSEIQQAVADEIDEVIAATLNQLAQKVVQGATGLLGLSQRSSTRAPSYLDSYRAQFYGGPAAAGSIPVASASSELDSYRIGNFEEAQALINNSGDPTVASINQNVSNVVNVTSNQQQEQIRSVADNAGIAGGATTNSALLRSSSQSSGTNPSGANDGITQTSAYMRGSATAGDEPAPWWSVELGQTKTISEVRIWKVSDKPASQTLETFRVTVSGESGVRWTSGIIDGAGSANPVVVPVNQEGSSIRIEKIAIPYECDIYQYSFGDTCYHPLELAEVEVITSITGQETGAAQPQNPQSQSNPQQNAPTSNQSGGASVTLDQSNSSLLKLTPSSTELYPWKSGEQGSLTFSLEGTSSYTIPFLEVTLYRNGQGQAFNAVFEDANIALEQGYRKANYQPEGSPGITFWSANVAQGSNTKVIVSGTPLPLPGRIYKLVITAKDENGTPLGTSEIDFVVQ